MDGLDFAAFDVLTFDCYGTLIDWEAGILAGLRAHPRARWAATPPTTTSSSATRAPRRALEAGGYLRYREVLARAAGCGLPGASGVTPAPAELAAFGGSVGDWPAFPDSADALARLHERFRLAVITNCDDDLFAASNRRLGVDLRPRDHGAAGRARTSRAPATSRWRSSGSAPRASGSSTSRRACSTTTCPPGGSAWRRPGSTVATAGRAAARRRPADVDAGPRRPVDGRVRGPGPGLPAGGALRRGPRSPSRGGPPTFGVFPDGTAVVQAMNLRQHPRAATPCGGDSGRGRPGDPVVHEPHLPPALPEPADQAARPLRHADLVHRRDGPGLDLHDGGRARPGEARSRRRSSGPSTRSAERGPPSTTTAPPWTGRSASPTPPRGSPTSPRSARRTRPSTATLAALEPVSNAEAVTIAELEAALAAYRDARDATAAQVTSGEHGRGPRVARRGGRAPGGRDAGRVRDPVRRPVRARRPHVGWRSPSTYEASRSWALLAIVAAIINGTWISIFVAWWAMRGIREVQVVLGSLAEQGLTRIALGLERLRDGDLTYRISADTARIERYARDDVGRTAESANLIRDKVLAAAGAYNDATGRPRPDHQPRSRRRPTPSAGPASGSTRPRPRPGPPPGRSRPRSARSRAAPPSRPARRRTPTPRSRSWPR